MAALTIHARAIFICLVHLLLAHLTSCQCNTNQNPYCQGNGQFEQICCTYPNVCYWSNRNGDPACCPAGTDCSSEGGPSGGFALSNSNVQQTTVQTTYLVQTVYTTTQPQYSTVTYYSSSSWQPWQTTTTTTYYPSSSQWQQWQTTTTVPAPVYTSFSTVATPNVVVVTVTTPVVGSTAPNGVYVTAQAVGNRASNPDAKDRHWLRVLGVSMLVYGMTWLI